MDELFVSQMSCVAAFVATPQLNHCFGSKFEGSSDLALDFADHLRSLEGVSRVLALEAQDKVTGAIGRALLLADLK